MKYKMNTIFVIIGLLILVGVCIWWINRKSGYQSKCLKNCVKECGPNSMNCIIGCTIGCDDNEFKHYKRV